MAASLWTGLAAWTAAAAPPQKPAPPQTSKPAQTPEKPAASPTATAEDAKLTAAAPVDPKSYIIGAEDVIFISVWREPDFTRPMIVRPDGKITMNLIGDIQASGLTPERLSAHIKEALQKYINAPDVNVSVTQVNSKKYYVNGEVNRSGPFPMPVPIRVLEALSNAGGFKDFANKKKILILRGTKRIFFNYNDVIRGKKMEQNIFLEPGDQIYVN
ncbi:MAG: polysaccharide biosynthesis/export family protein [Bryobacteraceae bacterium]